MPPHDTLPLIGLAAIVVYFTGWVYAYVMMDDAGLVKKYDWGGEDTPKQLASSAGSYSPLWCFFSLATAIVVWIYLYRKEDSSDEHAAA